MEVRRVCVLLVSLSNHSYSMTTLLDYRTTLRYLAYLGYPGDRRAAITTQPRRSESSRKKRNIRNVFLCCVIGAPHVGKSALLRGLIGKPFIASDAQGSVTSVVNSVEVRGAEKYLVVRAFHLISFSGPRLITTMVRCTRFLRIV